MTAPTSQVVQVTYTNPHASAPLIVPVLVICNTSDEVLERNVRANAARDLAWISQQPPHDRIAMMVGGGPSLGENLCLIGATEDQAKSYALDGLTRDSDIFAMNGASRYVHENTSVQVDYQVICDAKSETAELVDPQARRHLFASQVDPACFTLPGQPVPLDVTLWHLQIGDIERWFPEERVKQGGYALIGGGAAVGNSALALAYTMGYRTFHLFGYDSSHWGDRSHAYDQPMNRFIPCVDVEWAGKTYHTSVAMKAQAEKFIMTAAALKQAGCQLVVYGDGLLPAMYNTPPQNLTERDKYRLMWEFNGYREVSPGEQALNQILTCLQPEGDGLIVDFGCGTGRVALHLSTLGYQVYLVDFADNCRDEEAMKLPFLEWDLARPMPMRAPYGLCADVLEHIPPEQVNDVICNIMEAARTVFFQVATRPDVCGKLIGQPLHLSIHPHEWWVDTFDYLDFTVSWSCKDDGVSQLLVMRG